MHELRTRKTGDLVVVDVHLEVDYRLSVIEAHEISESARYSVIERHRVADVMTHVDPVGRG
ncbi:cation transporter dimerization domain-containing protein [Cupriavidus basilensis]|uniref:Cation transporter dimerization domain-containing protein n=1 Tax=Cupriavidus basilensis TaxID=68895 RepID=A0ABT6AU60_9BURK|nr:cation transporter dimerization domain-containing protein [Cupriavidus basilensis]MDF3836004.1 cation transporter dimerization domain-containing protein [Cupriavidus basilensis]